MLHVIICPQGSAVTGNSNGLQANSNGNGIQPKSDGLQPNTDGLQPTCDGLSFQDGRWVRFDACPHLPTLAHSHSQAPAAQGKHGLVVVLSALVSKNSLERSFSVKKRQNMELTA